MNEALIVAEVMEKQIVADMLRLMGNRDSNKIMADTPGITLDTIKKQEQNAINKMQARNRNHASIITAKAGPAANRSLLSLKLNLSS